MVSVTQQGLSLRCCSSCRSQLIYSTLPTLIGLREKTHSMRCGENGFGEAIKGQELGKPPDPCGASTCTRIVFPMFPKSITLSGTQQKGARLASCRQWGLVGRTVISSWGQGEDEGSCLGIYLKTGLLDYSPGTGGQLLFGCTLAWESTRPLLRKA